MSLYQKVRPKTLDDVFGSTATVAALRKLSRLPIDKCPHVFLFHGPSGCGKTTLARIVANIFEVDSSLNLHEYNSANTRGINDIRALGDMTRTGSFGGGNKCFILDEVHELLNLSQNDLLKVVEEAPERCFFVLCTTDPQGLIPALYDRCTKYEVSSLPKRTMTELLNSVIGKEKLEIMDEVVEMIVHVAGGSSRSALVALEQVLGIDPMDAIDVLTRGSEHDTNVIELCTLLKMDPTIRKQKFQRIFTCFKHLSNNSELIRKSILTFFLNRIYECDELEQAENYSRILKCFTVSTYYGGKSQLGAQLASVIFGD